MVPRAPLGSLLLVISGSPLDLRAFAILLHFSLVFLPALPLPGLGLAPAVSLPALPQMGSGLTTAIFSNEMPETQAYPRLRVTSPCMPG